MRMYSSESYCYFVRLGVSKEENKPELQVETEEVTPVNPIEHVVREIYERYIFFFILWYLELIVVVI